MDKNKQIDDLFRTKLGNYKPEFVPEHWQMMKTAIANPRIINFKSTGNSFTNIIIIISAILIVVSGIVTYVISERLRLTNIKTQFIALTPKSVNSLSFNNNFPDQSANTANSSYNSTFHDELSNNKINQPAYNTQTNPKIYKNKVKSDNIKNTTYRIIAKNNVVLQNKNDDSKNQNEELRIKDNSNTDENNKEFNIDNELAKSADNKTKNNINKDIIEFNVVNSNDEIDISSKTTLTDKEKLLSGISESEINVFVENESLNYSSIFDDYNAGKYKIEENKKQKSNRKSHNQTSAKKKNPEAPPDYKVGVVNNFAVNPAYTGYNQRHTVNVSTMVYKPLYKPGNDFNVPFEYSFAYDFNFGERKNCGIGIDYKRSIGAAEGSLEVDLTFAYRFNLAKYHNLRVGASFSYYSSDINRNDLSFPDMIDQRHGFVFSTNEEFPEKTTKNNLDLGMGVWYSWKSLYVGVSAIHLTSPDVGIISSYKIPREYKLSAGYCFNISEKINMLPTVELNYNEKNFNFSPSMLFTFNKWLLFGAEFQNLTNAGLVMGCNLKDNVIINIHTGIPMSKILINNFGIIDYAGINVRLQFGKSR